MHGNPERGNALDPHEFSSTKILAETNRYATLLRTFNTQKSRWKSGFFVACLLRSKLRNKMLKAGCDSELNSVVAKIREKGREWCER